MNPVKVAIIGGGLSGLYAAYLLEQNNFRDYLVLEARDYLGGRILGMEHTGNSGLNTFDLGPTWFWPKIQPQLDELITRLELQRFPQYETGLMVLERNSNQKPITVRGYESSPPSERLVGGMSSLIGALTKQIPSDRIRLNTQVASIAQHKGAIELTYSNTQGSHNSKSIVTEHVLLALPPRLVAERLSFTPPLPELLAQQWQATPTWMAPHAKYLAVYDSPFWREQGLSGSAQSYVGPMAEIHDASGADSSGKAALFGFIGVPAEIRQTVSEEQLKSLCRNQLTRLFGPQATAPITDYLKDWAQDPLTATSLDVSEPRHHAAAPNTGCDSGPWHNCITGIGSEWSEHYPGYVAGAIEAATIGVNRLLEQLN